MKGAFVALALGVCVCVEAAQLSNSKNHNSPIRRRNVKTRQNASGDDNDVPAYNFTMPVDHFDAKNKDTYPNRYFVNDTYYQPGGPVIFFDNGEAGFDPGSVADMLAENNGASLPMQIAANLSGLVIGWEHRYYGYSQPVTIDVSTGFPEDGVRGYKYLSVDQALEDVAYFANHFNQTKLDQNSYVNSTAGLDPYSTPWIFVGGSYPGARAAWMRVKYPEIIYASWASSAPLQYQFDGSLYFNPVMRSVPRNCTNDIKAAVKYFDDTLTSSDDKAIAFVNAGAYLTFDPSLDSIGNSSDLQPFDAGSNLANALVLDFQDNGPSSSLQLACDWMQSFDVDRFSKDTSSANGIKDEATAMRNNAGGIKPSSDGIAASNKGDDAGRYAFAAYVYGMVKYLEKSTDKASNTKPDASGGSDDGDGDGDGDGDDDGNDDSDDGAFTQLIDDNSWNWQTISETGIFQGSNPDNITSVSRFANATSVFELEYLQQDFPHTKQSELPMSINNKELLKMGGWDMTVSNVLFADGEFDPWRAFSVASQEVESSHRKIVQDVPGCNAVLSKDKAFGITYLGAVHAEDLQEGDSGATYVDGKSPLQQGLGLFLEAWKVWEPCFNQSRDSLRNGKGVDGKGNDATGKPVGSDNNSGAGGLQPFTATTVLAGLMALFLYY